MQYNSKRNLGKIACLIGIIIGIALLFFWGTNVIKYGFIVENNMILIISMIMHLINITQIVICVLLLKNQSNKIYSNYNSKLMVSAIIFSILSLNVLTFVLILVSSSLPENPSNENNL